MNQQDYIRTTAAQCMAAMLSRESCVPLSTAMIEELAETAVEAAVTLSNELAGELEHHTP